MRVHSCSYSTAFFEAHTCEKEMKGRGQQILLNVVLNGVLDGSEHVSSRTMEKGLMRQQAAASSQPGSGAAQEISLAEGC